MHGSQYDSTSLEGINGHIADSPPGKGPDNVLRSDTLNNLSKYSHSMEEVHQAPMSIVTRLVVQRVLLRSND
jgi:hypothetical protein